jgi:hypothetical protein
VVDQEAQNLLIAFGRRKRRQQLLDHNVRGGFFRAGFQAVGAIDAAALGKIRRLIGIEPLLFHEPV